MSYLKILFLNVIIGITFFVSLFGTEKTITCFLQSDWDAQIAQILDQADEIEKITLRKFASHYIDVSALSQFPNLKELNFIPESRIGPSPWSSLFNEDKILTLPIIPTLEKIKIDSYISNSFFPTFLEWLTSFENLKEIDLSNCFGILSSQSLAGPLNLVGPLNCSLNILSRLEHLEVLNLSDTSDNTFQSYDGLFGLKDIRTLKTLIYQGNHIFAKKVSFYPYNLSEGLEIQFLLSLDLEELDLSRAGLERGNGTVYSSMTIDLKTLFTDIRPQLKKLALNHANLMDFDFACFVPNLERLEIAQSNFQTFDLRQLEEFKNLKQLSMRDSIFTKDNLWEIDSIAPLMLLEELDLQYSSIKGMSFSFAPNLKKISLSESNASNGDITQVSTLSELEYLDLSKTKVTGTAIKKLAKLKKLKTLKLVDLDLNVASFELLNSVEYLDLQNASLSLDAFETLKNLRNLKWLNLKNIQSKHITEEDKIELRNCLPNCEIIF